MIWFCFQVLCKSVRYAWAALLASLAFSFVLSVVGAYTLAGLVFYYPLLKKRDLWDTGIVDGLRWSKEVYKSKSI